MQKSYLPLPSMPEVSKSDIASDPKSGVFSAIANTKEWFKTAHEMGCDALEINRGRTRIIDSLIQTIFGLSENKYLSEKKAPPARAAILALGGYGREEMGLYSDIDLLFLYDDGPDEYIREITDSILYPFWDNAIEVSGATRSLGDCVQIGNKDIKALTAMLDARFVAGSSADADRFFILFKNLFSHKRKSRKFIRMKLKEQSERLRRFGDSIYLLEPNVKEGEGGLRDYHTLLWIAKAVFPDENPRSIFRKIGLSQTAAAELTEGFGFLWRVRNALHINGEKTNRLDFSQQASIAASLGYKDGAKGNAAELFMQEYYRNASMVHLHAGRALEEILDKAFLSTRIKHFITNRRIAPGIYKTGDKISADEEIIKRGLKSILKLFALGHKKQLRLDAKTKESIISHAAALNRTNADDAYQNNLWTQMFRMPLSLDVTLRDMNECRLLKYWFGEFEPLFHQIQRDGFHFFTTDEHSIRTVSELGFFMTKKGRQLFPTAADALKKIKNKHILSLAVFFHDIGKGSGADHTETGAILGAKIARRIDWSLEDEKKAAFLIRSHLLMSKLAFRRDIKDPHLIERFAQLVENEELLTMLYLLSLSDIRAMGPHVWSDWKGSLLTQLYLNTLNYIQEATKDSPKQRNIPQKLSRVCELLGNTVPKDEIAAFFTSMPDRYLVQSTPESIASHLKMTARLTHKRLVTQVKRLPQLSEVAIATHDAPGLFANIAGALAINGINIVDAQLYTLNDGRVLDLLWISDISGQPILEGDMWKEFEYTLEESLRGLFDIHETIKRRRKKHFLTPKRVPQDTHIEIDNDVALQETVVDVTTLDRHALLYDISKTFFDLGCTIYRAKISTHVDLVTDVFYIRGAGGEKITSKNRLRQIQEAIEKALSS